MLETGGIESHVLAFVNELHTILDIDLLILDSRLNRNQVINYKKNCNRLKIVSKNGFGGRIFYFIWVLTFMKFNNYDVLYTNGQGDSIRLLRNFLKSIPKWIHHHHTGGDLNNQKTWSQDYLYTLMNCGTLNTCSTIIAKDLQQLLGRPTISIPCFSYPIQISKISNIQKPLKLAYFGRLIQEKGIFRLCRISKNIDHELVEFHIWGKGEVFDADFFSNYPKIKYHGAFNDREGLEKVLNFADAFILVSEHPEGLPISLLEVMGTGKPWIATKIGGIPDIAIDSTWNYLLPYSLSDDELKIHITNFANQLIGKKAINENQINLYNNQYSSRKLVETWLKEINS